MGEIFLCHKYLPGHFHLRQLTLTKLCQMKKPLKAFIVITDALVVVAIMLLYYVVAIMNGAGSCANNADNHLQPFAIMRTRRAVQKLVTVNILPRSGDGFSAILGSSRKLQGEIPQ